jgi:hypothetical protein
MAAVGEPGSAGMPIVHEHRRLSGVSMQRRGDAPDIPPIAGGDQGQQADGGMFGGVECSRPRRRG